MNWFEVATTSSNVASATKLATARNIGTLTGDVTSAGSTFNGSADNTNATVIANNAVTNAKQADMTSMTMKGNNTGATADPKDLTVSEVQTMIQDSTHRFVTDAQINTWNSSNPNIKYYNTEALAIADVANINLGDKIITFGATTINDGLGSEYIIENSLVNGIIS